jgi:hypothetical protein
MRASRTVLGLLVLGSGGLAAAQMQMPDARQMSGMVRPDPQVEEGKLTIRVVYGEVAKVAPEGTPVHLVAVNSDGTVVKLTERVNDEGRAEFSNLDKTGGTAYYAFCLLDGDRLGSDAITMLPKVGLRMMLAARKRDKSGAPIGDPIDDDHRDVPESFPVPAPGHVQVLVRGKVPAHTTLRLVEVAAAPRPGAAAPATEAPREVEVGGKDDQSLAELDGVSADPEKVWIAEITVAGKRYRSRPFIMSPTVGTLRGIVIHDKLLFALQGGAQLDDEQLWFELQMAIGNLTGAPFDTGAEGLLIPLPVGFTSGSVKDENAGDRLRVEPGKGVIWTGRIPPGEQSTVVAFAMPVRDGHVHVDMAAPLGILESQIAVERVPGSVVTGLTTGTAPSITRTEDGREFNMISNITVSPGDSLSFDVIGLPMRSQVDRWGRILGGVVVLLLLAGALWRAVLPRRSGDQPGVASDGAHGRQEGAARRRDLERRRDRLYDQLVALERGHAAGRIEDAAYGDQRRGLMAKLVVVLREIDDLDAGMGKAAQAS